MKSILASFGIATIISLTPVTGFSQDKTPETSCVHLSEKAANLLNENYHLVYAYVSEKDLTVNINIYEENKAHKGFYEVVILGVEINEDNSVKDICILDGGVINDDIKAEIKARGIDSKKTTPKSEVPKTETIPNDEEK